MSPVAKRYDLIYKTGGITNEDLKIAVRIVLINPEEYKTITGQAYVEVKPL